MGVDGIIGIVLLVLWIFCIVDAIQSPAGAVRNLPKPMWVLLVVVLPELGSLLWLALGRPRRAALDLPYKGNTGGPVRPVRPVRAPRPVHGSRPLAPDDDPEFLDRLRRREGGAGSA